MSSRSTELDASLFEFGFTHHRKVRRLSDAAFRLWVTAIDHANEDGSDGLVLRVDIDCYPHAPKTTEEREAAIAELVSAGLWEPTEDGWRIHDFLQWQESAAERKRRRTSNPDQPTRPAGPAELQPSTPAEHQPTRVSWPKPSQLGGVARAASASRTPAGRFQPKPADIQPNATAGPAAHQPDKPADTSRPPAEHQPTPVQLDGGGGLFSPTPPFSPKKEAESKEERESGSSDPAGSKGSASARDRKRRSQLPAGWEPTDEHRARASKLGLDLADELERFRLHAESTGRVMANWNAAFTTWLINSRRFAPRSPAGGRGAPQPKQPNAGQWKPVVES
jgi:hypothetical protein